MLRKEQFPFLATLALCFISFAILAYLTPMHSDDYGDALKALTFENILGKYRSWSGRLIADILSPILSSLPREAKAVATAFASTALLFAVSTLIPTDHENQKKQIVVFLAVYLAYWLFSPALGQTNFWIVGSANYLWMPLLSVIFIKFLISYIERNKKIFFYAALVFAVPAGLSNEASAVATLACGGLLFICNRHNKQQRVRLLFLISLCLLGFCVLAFAPGNTVRILTEGRGWGEISLSAKIFHHVPQRVLKITRSMLPVLIPAVFMIFYSYRSWQGKKYAQYGLIFLVSAFAASVALSIAAPWIAHRGISAIFIFYLCAFSSSLSGILLPHMRTKAKRILKIILACLLLLFTYKYVLMVIAYYNTIIQDSIRIEIVKHEKNNNERMAFVPDFFFTNMLHKRQEKFDIWLGYNTVMAYYFGIPGITLTKAVHVNYALIKTDAASFKTFSAVNEITNTFTPVTLYFTNKITASRKSTFIIGLSRTLLQRGDTLDIQAATSLGEKFALTLSDGIVYGDVCYFGRENISQKGRITQLSVRCDGKIALFIQNIPEITK